MFDRASAEVGDGDVLELIRSRLPGLSQSAQHVADAVLLDPEKILGMSAARLAEVSESSVGSVVRFCRSIGFPGYQAFKLRLATQTGPPNWKLVPDAIASDDRPPDVVDKVFASAVAGLSKTASSVDRDTMDAIALALRHAHRILIVAAGPSLPIASDFGNRLIGGAGLSVSYPTDAQTQQAAAGGLRPADVCFAISHSGTTRDTLESVRIAIGVGATTAALTSYATAPLAGLAEHVIIAGCPPDRYRKADMASRIVHHTVISALWVLVRHHQVEIPPAVT